MFDRKSINRRGIRESQKGIKMPKNGLIEGAGTGTKIDESFKDETNEKLSKLENDYFNFKGKGVANSGQTENIFDLNSCVITTVFYPI